MLVLESLANVFHRAFCLVLDGPHFFLRFLVAVLADNRESREYGSRQELRGEQQDNQGTLFRRAMVISIRSHWSL